jgi:hypothetical protein
VETIAVVLGFLVILVIAGIALDAGRALDKDR